MSAPTNRIYSIRTVWDFLDVPEDRRAECLHELEVWLALMQFGRAICADIPHEAPDDFEWHDDGAGDCRILIQAGDETIAEIGGEIRK
jgi:hypothetical protein